MPPRLIRAPFVCSRFLQQRLYTSTASSNLPPPPSGAVKLSSRRLLALHGPDTTHFLQGITTANVRPGQASGFYSSFLTATGRVLNDVFIYPVSHSKNYISMLPKKLAEKEPEAPAYFIEVDSKELEKLMKHLKRYKLRAKVDIRAVEEDEWNIWSVWNETEPWTPHGTIETGNDSIGCVDARAPGMGRRLIVPASGNSAPEAMSAISDAGETTLDAYTIRRMLRGVAEGQDEISRETSLPQESNIDFMGGIDFKKGCYVGQELTIRTHHTGVVRKRILPVALYRDGEPMPEKLKYEPSSEAPDFEHGVNILPVDRAGRSAGKWLTGVGNIGLALCRIEMMTDMVLTGEGSRWSPEHEFTPKESESVRIKAFVPDWHRSKTKIRNPQQRV